jgi:hypothetical protein
VNSPQLNRTPSLHAMSIAGKTMEFESNNPLARYSPNRKGSSSNLTESPKNIRSQMTYAEVMEEDKQKTTTTTTASSEEKEQQQKNIAALEEIKRKRIAEEEAATFSAAIISQEQEKQRQKKAAEDDEVKRKAAEKAAAEESERQRRADEEERTLQERNRQAAEKALALAAAKERQRKTAEEDETKRKAAASEKQAFEEKERQRKKAEEDEKKRIATEKAANEEKERQRKAAEVEESKRKTAAEQEAKRIATEKAAAEEKERLEKANSEPVTPVTTGVSKPASMAVELLSEKVPTDNRSSSVRASSIDDGFGDSISTLFIPAVSVEPIPGVVIKTKREDGTKIFVNVCHHSVIPVLNAENAYVNHPFYSDYLQLYFTQFTLNKARYVMHVAPLRETADKDGGTCFVSDVTVHSSVFEECSKDNDLCDKVSFSSFLFDILIESNSPFLFFFFFSFF